MKKANSEFTDIAQFERNAINVYYAEVVYEKLGTFSAMSALYIETSTAQRFWVFYCRISPFLKSLLASWQ